MPYNNKRFERFTFNHYLSALLTLFIALQISPNAFAKDAIQQVELSENAILLLDVRLNGNIILSSLDAYPYEDKVLVAIEPLFDALNLRYQLFSDRLLLWKGEDQYTLPFKQPVSGNFIADSGVSQPVYWANDGYFIFLDIDTLSQFFDVVMETNTYQLRLNIKTEQDGYLFPLQRIAILEKQRILAAAAAQTSRQEEQKAPPITIDDQYHFITMPNGRINASISWDEREKSNNYSVQMASDLLYHAADLTLNKTTDEELAARLRMTRYKTRPDELILGAFDNYSWGDVSGFNNNLTTTTKAGLGAVLERKPVNFRRKNLAITLQETAPPGWEAELFRNNQFIALTTVPNNGLLTFEDVPTEYGNNYFQIKLYSPYGEIEIIEKYLDLSTNALTEGAVAYNLFAFDSNHRLIDDQNQADHEVTDFGATLDYGIYDYWQIGFGFASTQDNNSEELQFYSMKNAFTLPGMLLENDAAMNQDGGYAQITSLIGNAFGNQRFALSVESAENYISSRINAAEESYSSFSGSYSGAISTWSYNFNANYYDQGVIDYWRLSNSLFTNFGRVYFSHSLNYFSTKNIVPVGTDLFGQLIVEETTTDSITGQLGVSGKLADTLRASGNINYEPERSSPILNSSSMLLEWSPKPFGIRNYLTARYQPLADSSNNWQLSHRVIWEHKKFQFTFSSTYNANEQWSLDAGIRFFLGYDQYNNRAIMRNHTSQQTATLDVHTYLDRQANGVPDPLDYDLSGVEFVGVPDWEGLTSGESGHTILPGATTNGPFYFAGKWKNGAETVNKDYVIYTHPGARIEVNMPFYLTSEIYGFVERADNNSPLNNVKVILKGKYLERETKSDQDGYFEFLGLQPDQYEVHIDPDYLLEKGLTGEVVGYTLSTPESGGFVELDVISLDRKNNQADRGSEKVLPVKLNKFNSESIIQEDNPRKRRNYFNLPVKDKLQAPHVLPDETPEQEAEAEPVSQDEKPEPKLDSGRDSRSSKESTLTTLPTLSFKQKTTVEPVLTSKALTTSATGSKSTEESNALPKKQRQAEKPAINVQKTYTIQAGAFKQRAQAEKLAESLSNLPHSAEIHSSGEYFRVIIGRFNDSQEANQFANDHMGKTKAYIRKLNASELQ